MGIPATEKSNTVVQPPLDAGTAPKQATEILPESQPKVGRCSIFAQSFYNIVHIVVRIVENVKRMHDSVKPPVQFGLLCLVAKVV